MGSEMCIRDSPSAYRDCTAGSQLPGAQSSPSPVGIGYRSSPTSGGRHPGGQGVAPRGYAAPAANASQSTSTSPTWRTSEAHRPHVVVHHSATHGTSSESIEQRASEGAASHHGPQSRNPSCPFFAHTPLPSGGSASSETGETSATDMPRTNYFGSKEATNLH